MIKEKKIPKRQCVGCREMYPKKDLIRVVKTNDGKISLDTAGKKSGRGAYICRNAECLKRAEKSRALERAFSCSISKEVYEELKESLSEAENAE